MGYIIVTTRQARAWWVNQMTVEAGTQPSIFVLEATRGAHGRRYRVQHNELGGEYLQGMNARAPAYARVGD